VIVRKKGTKLPFNIQDFQVIDYDHEDIASVDEARKKIGDFIRNGIKNGKAYSPVHSILRLKINTEATKLTKKTFYEYKFKNTPSKQICLVTGDIQKLKNVAVVWVSSENTNMQMSRHFELSVSGVVRHLGARKKDGRVVEDTIAKELLEKVGENASIDAGNVIVTGAGELEKTHGVKKIFHAASVSGQVGVGYKPIADIGMCVSNSLEKIDSDEFKDLDLRSILFPLMGTGQARGSLEEISKELIYHERATVASDHDGARSIEGSM
jgi:O-acetyl-ADP-ribose deacetylase (regulator of RNase III)